MKKDKIKLTIKPPYCRVCRERMKSGDLKEILEIIEQLIKNRLTRSTPITITIQKLKEEIKKEL